MKKGVVVLLVMLALIVLITPGIVGRLAEESMDQNLEFAATETEDVVITSQGFERGWFHSEGRHRIALANYLGGTADTSADNDLQMVALIVDTRIDHGLIPVTSMAREAGSLAPGLGSAVSTLSIELSDGSERPLPGSIFSEMGLTGALQSNVLIDADSVTREQVILDWSDIDFLVTANAASGAFAVKGNVDSLAMTAPEATVRVGNLLVDIDQYPGPYGYELGYMDVSVDHLGVRSAQDDFTMGPMALTSELKAAGDRVDGDATFQLANFASPFGAAEIDVAARFKGADGEALGKVINAYEIMMEPVKQGEPYPDPIQGPTELLARGMELHFDRVNLSLPQGNMTARMNLVIDESDPDGFNVPALLLALDGTLDLKVSQGLVDYATELEPSVGAAVGLGYLRKNGDEYETFVEIRSGVLTINGAPMQIPMSAFQ